MALDRDDLERMLKEKCAKSLIDFNAFMREVIKEVVETIVDGEFADHLGYEKHDQKTKATGAGNYTRGQVHFSQNSQFRWHSFHG